MSIFSAKHLIFDFLPRLIEGKTSFNYVWCCNKRFYSTSEYRINRWCCHQASRSEVEQKTNRNFRLWFCPWKTNRRRHETHMHSEAVHQNREFKHSGSAAHLGRFRSFLSSQPSRSADLGHRRMVRLSAKKKLVDNFNILENSGGENRLIVVEVR